jgi:hypothetical protein
MYYIVLNQLSDIRVLAEYVILILGKHLEPVALLGSQNSCYSVY